MRLFWSIIGSARDGEGRRDGSLLLVFVLRDAVVSSSSSAGKSYAEDDPSAAGAGRRLANFPYVVTFLFRAVLRSDAASMLALLVQRYDGNATLVWVGGALENTLKRRWGAEAKSVYATRSLIRESESDNRGDRT